MTQCFVDYQNVFRSSHNLNPLETKNQIKVVKKIIMLKSYHHALILFKQLTKLVKLREKENVFLDFEASTKGMFRKGYKFKIYYKFERKALTVD